MGNELTEVAIRAAKPAEKQFKLSDGKGLHLLIDTGGGRWWRFRYRHQGREKMLSLGTYPEVTLKQARERREEARRLVADGKDPSAARKAEKARRADTLEALAKEWFDRMGADLSPRTKERDFSLLERFLFPSLGNKPIADISARELLTTLQRVEDLGLGESSHRVRGLFGRIARYAIVTERAERDVSADLRGALKPHTSTEHAHITDPLKVGGLLCAIDGYEGLPSAQAALKLSPLVFVRPIELRGAKWCEFDLEGKEPTWRIPAERMKMGVEHLVPLSLQAVEILTAARVFTGNSDFVFPSARSRTRPISNNTVNAALRRLGYGANEMTGHGFRHTASTLLNEKGYAPDVIELQLAHKEQNEVRATYNKAQRLAERRTMMQQWADYLDELRSASKNTINRKAA